MLSIFPKSKASTQMPLNPDNWDSELIIELTSLYPDISGEVASVEYTNVDRGVGSATGFILLKGNVRIPFLVNNFKLSPLDVYIAEDGSYGYLTREVSSWLVKDAWPFKKISLQELAKLNIPFLRSGYISKTASAGELAEISLGLAALGEPEMKDALEKRAGIKEKPGVKKYLLSSIDSRRPVKCSDGTAMTLEKFAAHINDESAMSQLMSSGEYYEVHPSDTEKIASVIAVAKDGGNQTYEGNLFTIRSLDSGERTGKYMVVTRDGKFSEAKPEEIKGGDVSFSAISPDIGDSVLLIEPGSSAYGPFTLESLGNVNGEKRALLMKQSDHSMITVTFVDGMKAQKQTGPEKYAIPATWAMTKLVSPIMVKRANDPDEADMTVENWDGKFVLNHVGDLPTGVRAGVPIDMTEAIAALQYLGMTGPAASKVLGDLDIGGSVSFKVNTTPMEKKAEVKLDPAIEGIRKVAVWMSKFAEEVTTEEQTLDLILGLGLITKSTVHQYKAIIPGIKNTISDLARLLIAKRINPVRVDTPELPLTKVLEGLTSIMADIRRF